MNQRNPVIVQSDRAILLEVDHPLHAVARDVLAQFAELEKSPEHIHTYRLSPLSLWNAASGGMSAQEILELLTRYSKYDIPVNVAVDIREYVNRYGRVKLIREGDALLLISNDAALIAEIMHHKRTQPYLLRQLSSHSIQVDSSRRGHIKQALIHIGFPAKDLSAYTEGSPLPLKLRSKTLQTKDFEPRKYQYAASAAYYAGGAPSGGSGVGLCAFGAGQKYCGRVNFADD